MVGWLACLGEQCPKCSPAVSREKNALLAKHGVSLTKSKKKSHYLVIDMVYEKQTGKGQKRGLAWSEC